MTNTEEVPFTEILSLRQKFFPNVRVKVRNSADSDLAGRCAIVDGYPSELGNVRIRAQVAGRWVAEEILCSSLAIR